MAVLKLRRPKSSWASPLKPEFYDEFYIKIRGQDGKQILRNSGFTDRKDALREERRLLKARATDKWATVFEALNDQRMRAPRAATIGDAVDLLRPVNIEGMTPQPVLGLRVFAPNVLRRNVSSLFLVLAYATDSWTVCKGGMRGTSIGERVPDVPKLRDMPLTVLTRKLVLDYYAARVGEVAWKERRRENITPNKTLNHARNLFSAACRLRIYEGRLVLPDLDGFLSSGYLPEANPGPQPLAAAEFDAMCAAADALLAGADEPGRRIGRVNLLLRQSGIRVGSLLELAPDWLRQLAAGWVCEVRAVKGGTAAYAIPVSDEFAAIAAEVGALGATREERAAAVAAHNDWLAQFMPGDGVSRQRAHRLRDTVGTIAKVAYGLPVAVEMLGHAASRTTIRHYAKLQWDVSPRMLSELAAAGRLMPGNVVPLQLVQAKVA